MADMTSAMIASPAPPSPPMLNSTSKYFQYPYSLSPLPDNYKHGLYATGTLGLLSAASCIGMLMFVVYRFLTWRSHYKTFVGYNQYVLLIINLLLADMMQGISFMFSFHWIAEDGIFAPSEHCFSQGFLLNLGDLASAFFVFGIALHTFYGAVEGRHVKLLTLVVSIIFAWTLALLLSSIGPLMHRGDYFVRAGAWCWASPEYETDRLVLHYIWVFLIQFGTIIIYALIFLHLKRTLRFILPDTESSTHAKVDRAAKLMVMFPIAYILLTLPLSAGRMWSAAHHGQNLPVGFQLAAGSLIGSCGVVDCLLYTLTRRSLLTQSIKGGSTTELENSRGSWNLAGVSSGLTGITQTRTVTITGDRLSIFTDDSASTSSLSRSVGPEKTFYPTLNGKAFSLFGSQERITTPGIDGLDPRKGGRKVEITATPVDAEYFGELNVPTQEEVASIKRSGSPFSVRNALGMFKKASKGPDS